MAFYLTVILRVFYGNPTGKPRKGYVNDLSLPPCLSLKGPFEISVARLCLYTSLSA